MIFDSIENIGRYRGLSPQLGEALDWLGTLKIEEMEVKKEYSLDDSGNVYAFLQEYDTFPSYEKSFEGHRRYLDIQWMISGEEIMEVKLQCGDEREDLPYDEKRDIYKVKTAEEARILVRENRFAMFFPGDLHRPSLNSSYGSGRVRKLVVKVRVGE